MVILRIVSVGKGPEKPGQEETIYTFVVMKRNELEVMHSQHGTHN